MNITFDWIDRFSKFKNSQKAQTETNKINGDGIFEKLFFHANMDYEVLLNNIFQNLPFLRGKIVIFVTKISILETNVNFCKKISSL